MLEVTVSAGYGCIPNAMLEGLGDIEVCSPASALEEPWVVGTSHQLFRPGLSTGLTTIARSDSRQYVVRTPRLGCEADYRLVSAIVWRLAEQTCGQIVLPSGTVVMPAGFGAWMTKARTNQLIEDDITRLGLVEPSGQVVIEGPRSVYVYGPAEAIRLRSTDEGFSDRLFADIRRVQYGESRRF